MSAVTFDGLMIFLNLHSYLVHSALGPPRPLPYHRVERAEERAQVPLLAVRPLIDRRRLRVHLLHLLLLPQLSDRPV